MTADQWIQIGIFLMMCVGQAVVFVVMVSKNSRAAGALSATVDSFSATVKEFKGSVNESIRELYASRLKHEKEITALQTAIDRCGPCNDGHVHHRLEDELP